MNSVDASCLRGFNWFLQLDEERAEGDEKDERYGLQEDPASHKVCCRRSLLLIVTARDETFNFS